MKKNYSARYVRLYGTCDDPAYMPRLVSAAAKSGLGVYALVWFGFDGDDKWKARMASLVKTIQTNHQVCLSWSGRPLAHELLLTSLDLQ